MCSFENNRFIFNQPRKAVDAEELQSEGLDFQLDEQMKALALADEKLSDVESDSSSCFNMSTPSTKVWNASVSKPIIKIYKCTRKLKTLEGWIDYWNALFRMFP